MNLYQLLSHVVLVVMLLFISNYIVAATEEHLPLITISSDSDLLNTNIQATLRVQNESCTTSLARLERFETQIRSDISEASRSLGYYQATSTIHFASEEECWELNIEVEPGPRVQIQQVELIVDPLITSHPLFQNSLEENELLIGDFLNHKKYESLKSAITASSIELGFYSGRFLESEIEVNIASNTARISLVFELGPQYTIGELSIQNTSLLSESFLERLMAVREGDAYSSQTLFSLRTRLDNSQYFSQVNVVPQRANTVFNNIPIIVSLEPRLQHAYSTGIGFTTDIGPRLSFDYENRYANSNGHKFNTDLNVSQVKNDIDASYTLPLKNPSRRFLALRGGVLNENNDSYTNTRINLEVNYQQELNNSWLSNLFVSYQHDDYSIESESDRSSLTLIGGRMSKTRADNLVFPSKGWKMSGQLIGASDEFLSDTTLLQSTVTARFIRQVSERSRLLLKFDAGATWIKEDSELPVSLRFFAGGDQSIRGFKYKSIAPINSEGEIEGGKHLLISGVELDFRVKGNWFGAIFYDGGNAFSNIEEFEWEHSIGLGARWLSPIGPIRIDLAHPLEQGGVRFHVSMGPDL